MAKIGIDIGHGENTFQDKRSKGLIVDGKVYEEHHFNAQVGMKMKEIVETHGVGVFMAQQPYAKDVPLGTRTDMYNMQDLDLIVSIHANAADPDVRGLAAFYWSTSTASKKVAEIYKKHVESYNHNKYGGGMIASVKGTWSDFHMCRETKAPTILTENGFMTNKDDFRLIFQSQAFIQEVAEINARTALEYLGVKYMSDDKPVSKQVLTGGLGEEAVTEVSKYIKERKWWAELRYRGGENPQLLTGGLDPDSLKVFEAWLKAKKWYYKVYDKGKVPE